jgi:hypothetical protein
LQFSQGKAFAHVLSFSEVLLATQLNEILLLILLALSFQNILPLVLCGDYILRRVPLIAKRLGHLSKAFEEEVLKSFIIMVLDQEVISSNSWHLKR